MQAWGMLAVVWAVALLAPVAGWLLSRARWDRHPDGARGMLRDQMIFLSLWTLALGGIFSLIVFVARDIVSSEAMMTFTVAATSAALFSSNLPFVKRAHLRLLRTRYPQEAEV